MSMTDNHSWNVVTEVEFKQRMKDIFTMISDTLKQMSFL